jgi:hypothetical protein
VAVPPPSAAPVIATDEDGEPELPAHLRAAPAPVAAPSTFAELMARTTPLLADGSLRMPQLMEATKAVGVETLHSLASRPDLVPSVWTLIQASMAGGE